MLDINLIRKQPEFVKAAIAKRGIFVSFDDMLDKDKEVRSLKAKTDELKAERNKVSKSIPELKKANKPVEAVFESMRLLGEQIEAADLKIKQLEEDIFNFVAGLPNMPDEDLAVGDKEGNEVVYIYSKKPEFNFDIKNHVDLCEMHNLVDYKRGAKLAGNGNWIYTGVGARLEWALLNYFIDEHLKDGYEFMLIPHMLNYSCGFGAGQFPKFESDVYWVKDDSDNDNKFMLPTSETGLVNLHADEVLTEDELPKKYFGYTPCYRREAGSYRAEERGMIRGHQFNKVEMIQYTIPKDSDKAFYELVDKAKALVEKLGLHYRVSKLAAGDVSASMARTYDIEVWVPTMGYKEVSSVSNARDYQARRSNTKFRNIEAGKLDFVNTLNGSGLATSRIIPAIVEQFQQADGSIKVPQVLVKYLGLEVIK
ncbi:MAG: serine--tRNA ligase [Clostridia bacterium]|nr:serine--tRNA ligase [Clostridia bacterium]